MPTKIKYGEAWIERENVDDINILFNNEKLERMITRHIKIMREHCAQYPLMDKDRTVTIKLKLKPKIDKKAVAEGEFQYDKAIFETVVGSPHLPPTSVKYQCAVGSDKIPYYNKEDPKEPLQMTFRDFNETEKKTEKKTDDSRIIGKEAAVKG
jgi:hypothetical protein